MAERRNSDMKFERCPECGLTYDRHVRGHFCPHCSDFAWFYAIGVSLVLLALSAATALICLL